MPIVSRGDQRIEFAAVGLAADPALEPGAVRVEVEIAAADIRVEIRAAAEDARVDAATHCIDVHISSAGEVGLGPRVVEEHARGEVIAELVVESQGDAAALEVIATRVERIADS